MNNQPQPKTTDEEIVCTTCDTVLDEVDYSRALIVDNQVHPFCAECWLEVRDDEGGAA